MFARFFSTATRTGSTTNHPAYEIASRLAKLRNNQFTIGSFEHSVLEHSQGMPTYNPQAGERLATRICALENENDKLDAELKSLNQQYPQYKMR